ncbi:hypothetical protein [Cellulosilyticum lentocellum]|uniref:DNA-binding protein n=1 Tax=Cellulosilyticum lentocellum (strain ATCC 49066 / DSM 5427 / NCIMB 11756 / RHM5) TaxID=642492 RepID=F2JNA6_CELLD|nr:hypothetical protein [Cellulosilyticum lentocellum]ADZ83560.1 hypothetical protein Clole_1837 [Cellulosilyticum lentocellum DSM 5427]
MPKPKIYMAVTADSLELPLFVGTSTEVAAWAGITCRALYSNINQGMSGKYKGRKFIAIEEE